MTPLRTRFKNAWNAFSNNEDRSKIQNQSYFFSYAGSSVPWKVSFSPTNNKSFINVIYNQIAVDCGSINIRHVRLNKEEKYESTIYDSINRIFSLDANIDQTGRELVRDIVISMLDEGVMALVPIEIDIDPEDTESYKVYSVRVGKILSWYPQHVLVEVYNELSGRKEQILLAKSYTPIIENPFYSIMNEPNSTLQELKRVLSQINNVNSINSSGKIDLIIQLPYMLKGETKIKQAEERRQALENQLNNSTYGVGYIDGSEKVIQLNRAIPNNLWEQRNDLINELFNEMGMTKSIFDGTADEMTLLNYYNRTIEPIMSAICENVEKKWISKTARSQGQAMRFFKDPFKLVPVAQLAETVDKLTRNAVMTSNEFRSIIGIKPFDDPKADMLINHNLNQPEDVEKKIAKKSKSSDLDVDDGNE